MLLLVVGAAAYGGWQVLAQDEPNPYPSAWDAKVEPFVKIVEKERGLEFEHPIHVDFLSVKEFKDQVASERKEDLSTEDEGGDRALRRPCSVPSASSTATSTCSRASRS